jgi:transcriptional regulator with XRE-family HTH domain
LKLLKIDVRRFLNPTGTVDFSRFHSCAEYIKDRRQQLGLSPSQFADKAGYYDVFCDTVEANREGLLLYPPETAAQVAQTLQIPADDFLEWILIN